MSRGFIEVAKSLDGVIKSSSLHKQYCFELTTANGEYTATCYLFASNSVFSECSELISSTAEEIFPKVFYLAINAHYDGKSLPEDYAKPNSLALVGLEDRLDSISIELCFGAGYQEVGDEKVGDLVLAIDVSPEGNVGEVYTGLSY